MLLKMQMFSLELMKTKETGTLGVRCKTHGSEMFLYLCHLFIN